MAVYDRIVREICRRLSPLTQRLGFVLSPVHFYFPIPDTRELSKRNAWERSTAMAGIDWDLDAQLEWLERLRPYTRECRWPESTDPQSGAYGWRAATFGYCSAMFAHAMVRYAKPRRIVEIGCGWSSTILLGAGSQNERSGAPAIQYLGIDPYPPAYLSPLVSRGQLRAAQVQDIPLDELTALGAGDILFIDSSHVLNIGSDVQWLYLEVLPRLSTGVIVHIHDIQLPYEYPREYAEKQRWFWNEQYLLQALLVDNPSWEILAAGYALCRDRAGAIREIFPDYNPALHGETGSFWMRRR